MPARKRTNAVADDADEPPIAKRRSSRQAAVAAATASKAAAAETDTAVKSDMKKQHVKSSPAPSKALKKAKTGGGKGDKGEEGQGHEKDSGQIGQEAERGTDVRGGGGGGGGGWRARGRPGSVGGSGRGCDTGREPGRAQARGRVVLADEGGAGDAHGEWARSRNNMRNMNVGDKAFFYHSNCKEPGIVGIMEIVKEFSEDKSARRPGTPYYDPSSTKDKPKWDLVHVEFRKKFAVPIYLKELRKLGEAGGPLAEMQMLKLGRLSVSKVSAGEWRALCELADEKAKEAGLKHEE
ncbi:Thymocyte nuclear protein 1 [Beauveria bassiana D1-5]|uniref:Thymocyte nuclear protein 1 n=1 Tax=Beauveria bassiana D1-5 TaxID=1245745 RepID=A0A0A2VKZ6_BEABA|nr:Thymocyte nuclear protein 1 [Beauveria bassiana D1-5]